MEDDRPAEARQQTRDELPAEEAADGVAGEHEHDHAGAVALRCVIRGERDAHRHRAADADAGKKAQQAQHAQRARMRAQQRRHADEEERDDENGLPPEAVAGRPRQQSAHQDANAREDEGHGEGLDRQTEVDPENGTVAKVEFCP